MQDKCNINGVFLSQTLLEMQEVQEVQDKFKVFGISHIHKIESIERIIGVKKQQMRRNDAGDWIEEGRDYITAHDQNGHVTSHALPDSPPTLQQRIFVVVAQSGRAVTRREIAKALGLKSTGWLNDKIDGMVSDGYLSREHGRHYNGVTKFLYEVCK